MARVKVLLMEDVMNVGLAGEIFTVAGGYARNYLMPRGLAVLATKGAMKQAEDIRQAGIRRRAQMRADAEAQAAVISQQKILFQVRAGENGRLYGSVTTADIAERLEAAVGFEVDRRRIVLDQPIRDLGLFDVALHIMPEVDALFAVGVVRENQDWSAAEAIRAQEQAIIAAAEKAAAEAAAAAAAVTAAQLAQHEAEEDVAEEDAEV